ncbi:MAG: hypothetical protein MUF18_17830, partial [Fimbriiglobus sp.]|nr:hypothetical protein [Fimbriiglobus sp.]
ICYRLDLKKDTVVTRDLFAAYADRFLGPDSPPWRVLDFAEESRGVFKHLDANRDGKLTREECSPGLQERFSEADTDKDGIISPGEYRDYLTARVGYESRFAPLPEPPKGEKKEEQNGEKKVDEPEEPRPVVYHDAKSLPKDLPGWFRELDIDKDFQIGLYEWVAGKRLTSDFEAMDLNNDGLLEVAEYLRYRKKLAEGGKGDLHAIAPGGKEQGKKK